MNTLTGKLDWEIQSEDYDYQQELARAGFADMLHDLDRVNNKIKQKLLTKRDIKPFLIATERQILCWSKKSHIQA